MKILFHHTAKRPIKYTRMRYTVLMDKNESGGYTVTVPSLPGCVSQGDSRDEALKNIENAIAGYSETLKMLKKPVPVEVEVTIEDSFP